MFRSFLKSLGSGPTRIGGVEFKPLQLQIVLREFRGTRQGEQISPHMGTRKPVLSAQIALHLAQFVGKRLKSFQAVSFGFVRCVHRELV